MTEADYLQLHDSFSKPVKTVITGHKSPDGDAVGSALGLYHYLTAIGQEDVRVVLPDSMPHFLQWMPGVDDIIIAEDQLHIAEEVIYEADYVFCLDYNSLNRTGKLKKALSKTEACIINIDHHRDSEEFAEFMLADDKASSTAELLYEFIRKLSFEISLPAESAQCIFTGIITDTGSFKYSSTGAKTHEIAAALIRSGVKPPRIYDRVFEQNRLQRLKLVGYVLNEKLEIIENMRTALISLSQEELNKYEYVKGDTEGLVNYGLSIKNTVLAVFLKESEEGYIKMSFRSKGNFDVNQLARKHFNGGGHVNAAGGKSDLSLPDTIDKIKKIIPEYEAELKSTFS